MRAIHAVLTVLTLATPLAASRWLLGYSGGFEVGVMVWVRFLEYEMKMTKK